MPKQDEDDEKTSLPDGAFLDRAADALFAARTVLVYGEVSTRLARTVSAQLLALAASSDAPTEAGTRAGRAGVNGHPRRRRNPSAP